MEKLLKIAQIIDTLNQWIGKLTYWLILVMVFTGVWNVFGRYLGRWIGMSLTSNALIEMQWYLFDIVFFLGAAYTLLHQGHVRVDLLYKDWSEKRKAWVNFLGSIFFLIPFCLLIIYFSYPTIFNSWKVLEMSPDPNGLPRYPIKSMIIVNAVLLSLQGVSEAIKNLAILRDYNPKDFNPKESRKKETEGGLDNGV